MKTLVVYSNVDGFAVQLKNHLENALDELQIEWKECHLQDVVQASESFVPTMHIFYHPNKQIYEYLPAIQTLKGHKLLWQLEDPYESDLTFDMLPHFYYTFTSDENTAKALKKEAPGNHVQFVPHACNPKVHRPEEVSWEYKSDFCFIGNAYDSRIKFLEEHAEIHKAQLVTLIGVGYRGLDGYQDQHVIHGHISEPEMVKYYNGAKCVYNLHRQNSDLDMANKRKIEPVSFNNRYYEVMACGRDQAVWGRGANFMTQDIDYKLIHKEHSYKKRLIDFYLPLLKK